MPHKLPKLTIKRLGLLMLHKTYPGEAVDGVTAWVAERRREKEEEEQKK